MRPSGREPQDFEEKRVAADPVVICEHEGCSEPKREGSGKGAPPKYCEAHSNPKNRK